MPTDGFITSFNQTLPIYADKAFIANTFSSSLYNKINENVVGAAKFYASAINGINDDDVRISKRRNLSTSRLRGFESGKVGPKDGNDFIGGNYITSFSASSSIPKILENSQNLDVLIFYDAASIWGVDYDSAIDDNSKIRSSVGLGVDWFTVIGPLNFSLAHPLTKSSTDITETFRFNLGTTF